MHGKFNLLSYGGHRDIHGRLTGRLGVMELIGCSRTDRRGLSFGSGAVILYI
jgi:hypothetical protein